MNHEIYFGGQGSFGERDRINFTVDTSHITLYLYILFLTWCDIYSSTLRVGERYDGKVGVGFGYFLQPFVASSTRFERVKILVGMN